MLLLSLLTVLAVGDSLPGSPLAPGPAVMTAQGAAVVLHRQPAVPLVALRLSLLADDPPGYAGAGHLLQHLILPGLRDQVAVVGGRVQAQRTSDAVVYSVVGPADELSYLSDVLRSTLRPPRVTEGMLLRASRELAEERLAEWETADQHVRAALRARLFPNDVSAAGTEASAERLVESDAIGMAWTEMYRPERVSVVAVGAVSMAEVEAAFANLPPAAAGAPAGEPSDTLDAVPLAPAEATQGWLGMGYLASDLDPAALSVAARLVQKHLQARLGPASVAAEHWWTQHGQALAVVVAVPGAELPAAQRTIGTAVSGAAAELSPALVSGAAREIRREMLFYARTPERMAEVLGRFTDRDGDPDAAQRFYAQLERVDPDEVREVLRTLLGRTPVRMDIPPQKTIRQ